MSGIVFDLLGDVSSCIPGEGRRAVCKGVRGGYLTCDAGTQRRTSRTKRRRTGARIRRLPGAE